MAKLDFNATDHTWESGLWLSFDQWASNGYGIIKGERSRRRIDGVPVFHQSQVLNVKKALISDGIKVAKYNPCFDKDSDLDHRIDCTMAGEFGFFMSSTDRFLDVDFGDGEHWSDAPLR